MREPAITADSIGKEYIIGGAGKKGDLRDTVGAVARAGVRLVSDAFRGRMPKLTRKERFWALRDVSFEVPQGQALGIIGRNGSGKSTLLRILSRVTPPTEGEATTVGRIGSLLEIGAGFHMELTGRENVFLSGAILGMKRREIISKFEEIVEFSGVRQFIDTPVKRYSSGMYLRLAFAVAAYLNTEILLVDEVLAVGDSAFQRTCLEKLSTIVRDGRTVLFVSHNLAAVARVCDHAIVLDHGRIVFDGGAAEAIAHYDKIGAVAAAEDEQTGTSGLAIRRLGVGSGSGRVDSGRPFTVSFELNLPKDYWMVSLGFGIRTVDGERIVFDVLDSGDAPDLCRAGRYLVTANLPELWLRPRGYIVQAKATAYPAVGEFDKVLSETFEFTVDGKTTSGLLDPLLQPPVKWDMSPRPKAIGPDAGGER